MARKTARKLPTEQEVIGYLKTQSNWGRWGKDDQIGTMNLLTPEKTARAAQLVREGVTVTCARPVVYDSAPDVFVQPQHFMFGTGEGLTERDMEAQPSGGSMDYFGMVFHGHTITHVDALCHAFWKGQMYNGFPGRLVGSREGAQVGAIDLLHKGIAGRGVLLDIPRLRGVKWLEPGTPVLPKDLEEAEKAQKVRVEEGDILLVRTGHWRKRVETGPVNNNTVGMAGPQAACIPWLRERGVAMLGCDSANDVAPSGYSKLNIPMHHIGIVALGLWLLDNANLDDLAQACAKRSRWEFFFTVNTLRLANATGSPVNPVAVF
ncbi:MAG: cyclase family protein [Chloroflexi bacterium]|nr:cyclase family protein [Chloroflexota bacterium]